MRCSRPQHRIEAGSSTSTSIPARPGLLPRTPTRVRASSRPPPSPAAAVEHAARTWGWQRDSGVSTNRGRRARRDGTADHDGPPQQAPTLATRAKAKPDVWPTAACSSLRMRRSSCVYCLHSRGSPFRHAPTIGPLTRVFGRPELPQRHQESVRTQQGHLSRRMLHRWLQPAKFRLLRAWLRALMQQRRTRYPGLGHVTPPRPWRQGAVFQTGDQWGARRLLGSGMASRLPRCGATVLCACLRLLLRRIAAESATHVLGAIASSSSSSSASLSLSSHPPAVAGRAFPYHREIS